MTLLECAKKLRSIIEKAVQSLDDETALEAVTLFETWQPGASYPVGRKVRYAGLLYNVLIEHTSQTGWEPTNAPSLYAKVLVSMDGTVLEWEQPDSTNTYMTGDRVLRNGKVYESTVDNNVWAPELYPDGWKLIEEDAL